jgi:tetratricopeptide (TPR) repeat protein
VQKFDTPLKQATTPSLEALQVYSSGAKAVNAGDFKAAVLSMQRAIAFDPNFALAYSALAASYANLGESSLASANAKKAYELRDKVSGLEKFLIEAQYNWIALGDLEKSRDVLELFAQTYPRDSGAHFNLGNVYDCLGQYEKALAEARESVRLEPDSELSRDYLVYSYLALNRFDEAQNAAKEALAKNIPLLNSTLYTLAFLENDAAGMARQVASAMGKPGVEDLLLGFEADRVAYAGKLVKARELSQRAVAAAEQAKVKETAASHEASAALREALFGNGLEARQLAAAALKRADGRDVRYAAALALALAGDSAKAQSLADDLSKLHPEDTIVRLNYLPTLRAQLALNHQDAAKAIDALQIAVPYDLMTPANPVLAVDLYPVFVRGEAYLASHRGGEAAAELQKIIDHRGIVLNSPLGALAHLGLARAYTLQGDTAQARVAYQDFLTLWKDADPDIPVFITAKAEYAKLK